MQNYNYMQIFSLSKSIFIVKIEEYLNIFGILKERNTLISDGMLASDSLHNVEKQVIVWLAEQVA